MTASSDRHRLYRLIHQDQKMRNLQEDVGWRPGSRDRPIGNGGYDPVAMEATLPFIPQDHHIEMILRLRSLGR